MTDPLTAVRTRGVPQSEQTDPAQVPNSEGGWSFTADWQQQLTRFLVLGTSGGSFYASERDLTADNADRVKAIIAEHGRDAVDVIVRVSVEGRAPRQQPTLFALALAASAADVDTRQYALSHLRAVCRTGTMLFEFTKYAAQFRGRGRALNRAVSRWYTEQDPDDLAYQLVKYQSRDGWAHRDLLRLVKPKPPTARHDLAFQWAVGKGMAAPTPLMPARIFGSVALQGVTDRHVAARLVAEYDLPWECVPSELLNEPVVWEALLERLPVGALLRQLPRLTRIGLLDSATFLSVVTSRLTDPAVLKRARLHPLLILNALMSYKTGSARSGGEFRPVTQIVDALDAAFYASFGAVTPVGKPVTLALDISLSMTWDTIAGTALTPRDASAALALITAATEPDYEIVAFSGGITPVTISPRQRLDDVVSTIKDMLAGPTDCALPMTDAMVRQRTVGLFTVYTDSETRVGPVHPHVALQHYRDRMSQPDARLAVVGMLANRFTIADPSDPRELDVVGFDTATPELISAFGRGEV